MSNFFSFASFFYTSHRKSRKKNEKSHFDNLVFLLLLIIKHQNRKTIMSQTKQVYKNPKPGQPLISTISSGCKTPILEVKFCNLVNPFRYPNSPTVPRYSVTCVIDPKEHKEFLKGIQTIEKDEKVDSILKNETFKENDEHLTTGKILIKFQTKDVIPVYLAGENYSKTEGPQSVELEDELARGEKIMIIYDILRYTKKNTMTTEHGISFKPSCIWYYPNHEVK